MSLLGERLDFGLYVVRDALPSASLGDVLGNTAQLFADVEAEQHRGPKTVEVRGRNKTDRTAFDRSVQSAGCYALGRLATDSGVARPRRRLLSRRCGARRQRHIALRRSYCTCCDCPTHVPTPATVAVAATAARGTVAPPEKRTAGCCTQAALAEQQSSAEQKSSFIEGSVSSTVASMPLDVLKTRVSASDFLLLTFYLLLVTSYFLLPTSYFLLPPHLLVLISRFSPSITSPLLPRLPS